jgi:hypothetical protein
LARFGQFLTLAERRSGAPKAVIGAAGLSQWCQAQRGSGVGLRFVEAIVELIVAELLKTLQLEGWLSARLLLLLQSDAVVALDAH